MPSRSDLSASAADAAASLACARERERITEQIEPILAGLERDGVRITPAVKRSVEATVEKMRSDALNRQIENAARENPESLFVKLARPFTDPSKSRERLIPRRSTPHQGRSRAARSAPTRTRGSRRSGTRAGPDPGDPDPAGEPPPLAVREHRGRRRLAVTDHRVRPRR